MHKKAEDETIRDAKLQGLADEIRALQKQEAEGIIASGLKLKEARSELNHGEWGPWLDENFGWDRTTAYRRMRVADRFKCCNVQHIAPSLLYVLAAPSVPDALVDEIRERANAGERITVQKANEIIRECNRRGASGAMPAEKPTAEKVTIEITVGSVTKLLRDNFLPKDIYAIYQKAINGPASPSHSPLIESVKWLMPAVTEAADPFPKACDSWVLRYCFVDDGFIFATNGTNLVAAAPFQQNISGFIQIIGFALGLDEALDPVLTVNNDGGIVVTSSDDWSFETAPPDLQDLDPITARAVINKAFITVVSKKPIANPLPLPTDFGRIVRGFYRSERSLRGADHEAAKLMIVGNEFFFPHNQSVKTKFDNFEWPEDMVIPGDAIVFMANTKENPVEVSFNGNEVSFIYENGSFIITTKARPELYEEYFW